MINEYELTIQAAGTNEAEAVETAIRMLNAGANFDSIRLAYETTETVETERE